MTIIIMSDRPRFSNRTLLSRPLAQSATQLAGEARHHARRDYSLCEAREANVAPPRCVTPAPRRAVQLLLRMRTGLFQAGSAIVDPAEPADRMSVIVTGRSTRPLPAPAPRPRRPLAPLRHLGHLSAHGWTRTGRREQPPP